MCLKPLHGFAIGETENGKVSYKVCSNSVIAVRRSGGDWFASTPAYADILFYIEIGCGQCIECRLALAST